ncbi:nuclear pore complex protein Nup50 [Epargyreus clarus]|uniref:nuclear pore complex protein Nup50 n=1 Tax=Epargyreus clarus TaxID=520877 RepID=UPI003C2B3017
MSTKRQATTELNHDNWDQEQSSDHEEMGTFKLASKDVLEKRVIRTAKRRSQAPGDETKKSVFSGFGGFNKVQKSSFDFLANLTNGNKSNNTQPTTPKMETTVSSSIFTNKSLTSTPNTGLFGMSGTGFTTKSTLGKSPEGSSLFGGSLTNTSPMQSVFTASKADSTVNDSPFKVQNTSGGLTGSATKTSPDVSTSQVSSTIFGVPSNTSANKSLFSSTTSNSTLFPTQPVSSTSTTSTNSATTTKADSNTTEPTSKADETNERRLTYFSKLKGLNESVSDWIKKHVEETPLCILSPIFQDYEKYLREIQTEYKGGQVDNKNDDKKVETKPPPEIKTPSETKIPPATNNVSSSIFGNLGSSSTKIETPQNNTSGIGAKSSSFSFGINTPTSTTANTGFSFGINPSTASTASSLFSVNTTTTASAPFSFGINKGGFNFNPTSPPKTETKSETKEEDDEPPKVEYTPVVEDNSIFDIKCKIFIKKDGNFVDKGVGTLYIKKIDESSKHQLLVRANTNLGTVLLNLVLSSSIPTQRMGKNNVMLVCIPTPDAKPPPTPILIRVKTAEEADNLLSTLNKHKA